MILSRIKMVLVALGLSSCGIMCFITIRAVTRVGPKATQWSPAPFAGVPEMSVKSSKQEANVRRRAMQQVTASKTAILPWATKPSLELTRARRESDSPPPEIHFDASFEGGAMATPVAVSRTHFQMDFGGHELDMFLFKLTGVKGQIVRIDLKNINVRKLMTLNPLVAEVPSLDQCTFQTTTTPFAERSAQSATGPLIPEMTGDWRYIADCWPDQEHSSMCFVHKFTADTAYIAMKFPYTGSYDQKFLADIARHSGTILWNVGESKGGRPLHILGVYDDINPPDWNSKPCVLMYAREHADENDTSWVVDGAIRFLLSDNAVAKQLRKQINFLFIPMLDPDAAAQEVHHNIIESFRPECRTPESDHYAAFFMAWANKGHRLDVTINLHNLESAEGPHLSCPAVDVRKEGAAACREILDSLCDLLESDGFLASDTAPHVDAPNRLAAWLEQTYGTLNTAYEVNSQESHRHLTLSELQWMGRDIIAEHATFLTSDVGRNWLNTVTDFRRQREDNWAKYGNALPVGIGTLEAERSVQWQAHGDQVRHQINAQGISSLLPDVSN